MRALWILTALIGLCSATPPLAAQAQQDGAAALAATHQRLQPALARSPFARPLILASGSSPSRPHGDVYAVVEHPFPTLVGALRRADHWCEMLILPFNTKRCVAAGPLGRQVLDLAVGRKFEEPLAESHRMRFDYAVRAADDNHLSVQMAAAEGPLGTSDYRLTLEAVPIRGGLSSFIHLSYSYAVGMAARLATDAYLATGGRNKVGFSVAGDDADGQPALVRGIQGVAERNTMRYFLAIEAFLKTLSAPEDQRLERRLREWFAATERYPKQLREMDLDSYLAMKRREAQPTPAGQG